MAIPSEGQFTALRLDSNSAFMLEDAYHAVSSISGAWDYLKRADVPETGSFMKAPSHPILDEIQKKMEYVGHSGSSYGWTMQTMKTIAVEGWDVYSRAAGIIPLEERQMSSEEAIELMFKMCPNRDMSYVERRMRGE